MTKSFVWLILAILIIERIIETVLPDRKKEKGKVTGKWVFYCFLISGFACYGLGIFEFAFRVTEVNVWVTSAGIGLIAARVALKIWAVTTLGKYWSIQIEIREGHKLIKEGPYKFVRHPSYLSTLIEVTAGPLILNAYYTLIFVWLVYFPFMLMRIWLEETELLKKFGKEFEEYREKVPLIIPFLKSSKDRVNDL
ncbi:MAG: hypothetical protein A2044_06065 [Candidatus Firestonebacteria bacterium GWA2_43_8]|nr:MAG: hypothetical protein A2044_06065 [Candidatus Firestonebacteria bacterium GWA2_43_8]